MNAWITAAVALLTGSLILAGARADAQHPEWPILQGDRRAGYHTGNLATEQPSRTLLRWWSPLFSLSSVVDNVSTDAEPFPSADWSVPLGGLRATGALITNPNAIPLEIPYVLANGIASTNFETPWLAATTPSEFRWNFTGLTAGDEYAIEIRVPVGPTDLNPDPNVDDIRFGADLQVYRIDGVENVDDPGQPVYVTVDVFAAGADWARLGGSFRLFRVAPGATEIRVVLLNTIPRNSQGQLVNDPATTVVYADAARLSRPAGELGSIQAQPTVGRMTDSTAYPWRVISARNEPTTAALGSTVVTTNLAAVTSFTADGVNVPTASGVTDWRRNKVWAWPVGMIEGFGTAARDDYGRRQADWIFGREPGGPGVNRSDQVITMDDSNARVRKGSLWLPGSVRPGFLGTTYHETPNGGVNSIRFEPLLPEGGYRIDAFIPGGNGKSARVTYELRLAGVTVAQTTIDQSVTTGWVRLNFPFSGLIPNTATAPISVVIPASDSPDGAVVADQMRFVRVADLSVTSTPISARIAVNGADRDVVIIPMENGRIYCVEAVTNEGGAEPARTPQVLWTYPTEATTDPNRALGLDGPDLMAEMPTGFGLSAGVVQRVTTPQGVRDLLWIGSQNGRIYCLDLTGRGDGSIERRWTFPSDYPSPNVESPLGPITGSVTFATLGGQPTLLVPTLQGRLYALDAIGDPAPKTTSIRWAFPPVGDLPAGRMRSTPVVGYGVNPGDPLVFVTTDEEAFPGGSEFEVVAVDGLTGAARWRQDTVLDSNTGLLQPFVEFNNISPIFMEASQLNAGVLFGPSMPNTLYVGNVNGFVGAFSPVDGSVIWGTDEGGTPSGPMSFSYLGTPAPGGALVAPTPHLVFPNVQGALVAYYADPSRLNTLNMNARRTAWQIPLTSQRIVPASFGGPLTPVNNWMYGADGNGYVFAWSHDPNLPDGGQTITPGAPPIQPITIPFEDPGLTNITTIGQNARVALILPGDFERLSLALQITGQVTWADVQAAVGRVTRTSFEMGEQLYVMAYELPDPDNFAPPVIYQVNGILNPRRQSSSIRQLQMGQVTGAPSAGQARMAIGAIPVLPTGQSSLIPGPATLIIQIVQAGRQGANASVPSTRHTPSNLLAIANPLAYATVPNPSQGDANSIGFTTNPAFSEAQFNGNQTSTAGATKSVRASLRPDLAASPDFVSHGQNALSRVFVYDRSLVSLIRGRDRGLSGVKVQTADLSFTGGASAVVNPLSATLYPGLEDLPGSPGNNVSLDYPDIRRSRMIVTKQQFGAVENPQFGSGVTLLAPAWSDVDFRGYRTDPATYNSGMSRQLLATTFDFEVSVPRFQPPTTYLGRQLIYIEDGQSGVILTGAGATEAYRELDLAAAVNVDVKPVVGTATVDLGSIPSGGGFLPLAPWAAPDYRVTDPRISDDARFRFFQRFVVRNEGNVNLLNLRVAKQIDQPGGTTLPVTLFSASLHPLAELDTRGHLITDLDPAMVDSVMGLTPVGNRAIMQKARPDDGEPTRFTLNPRRRANPNLNVADGFLFGSGNFLSARDYEESMRDPKVAVAPPIGTPVGNYEQALFVFEDLGTSLLHPVLDQVAPGVFEPYSPAPLNLRFAVRETRLTSRQSNKAAPMVDSLGLTGREPHTWGSQSPSILRTSGGHVVIAFESDRLAAGVPGFVPSPKLGSELNRPPRSSLYFATLRLRAGTPTSSFSAISELSGFEPAVSGGGNPRWFVHSAQLPASGAEPAFFGVPAASLDLASIRFRFPTMPTSGFSPALMPSSVSSGELSSTIVAFVGEADITSPNTGVRERQSRLGIASLSVDGGGNTSVGPAIPLNIQGELPDGRIRIGKPTVVVDGAGGLSGAVFFPASTGSNSQIYFAVTDGTTFLPQRFGRRGGGRISRLEVGEAFESLTSPSASLRRQIAGGRPDTIVDLVFTGRVRGRSESEIFYGRLPARQAAPTTNRPQALSLAGQARLERLTVEPATGLYWATGADYIQNFNAADATNRIDILREVPQPDGTVQRISILNYGSRQQVEGSAIVTFASQLGGTVYIDLSAGSVRLQGVVVPRNSRLFFQGTPTLLRMASGGGQNHRGSQILFDPRPAGENALWFSAGNAPLTGTTTGFNDRILLGYAKTSSVGPSTTRSYLRTFRFGVPLTQNLRTNNIGRPTFIQVTGATAAYQVDPANGRVYFNAAMENVTVSVTYDAVDDSGRFIGRITDQRVVRILPERGEFAIPIDEVANEGAPAMALDLVGGYNGPVGGISLTQRPGLIWMVWSSTRGGGTDLYLQTIAPRFSAIVERN